MEIKVKGSTMVKPMTERPSTTVWLSNLDFMLPEFHSLTHYFYRSTGAPDFFDPDVLKAALSTALVEFYPVAGRMNKDKDRAEINCNGHGALFLEAESDATLDDLGDLRPRSEITLIPKVNYSQEYPLFLVQVTRFKCGGVCLGIAIDHQLADGISSIHFINTWSDIARGLEVEMAPFIDRRVLSARKVLQPELAHIAYQLPPRDQDHDHDNSELSYSIFKLKRDQLNALKAHCNEDEAIKYTSFEVLAGHVWRCMCKSRGLPEDEKSRLTMMVDGRPRMRPPLPRGYLGNAVFMSAQIASCGEVVSNPLKFVVSKVREALARMDDDYLRSAIDFLEVKGGLANGLDLYESPNFVITSWARLPLYDADFGWGRPDYVGPAFVPPQGILTVLPTPPNDGALFLSMSIPKEHLHDFQEKLFSHF